MPTYSRAVIHFKTFTRWLLSVLLVAAGANHFIMTAFYVGIMPPYLPWPLALVYLSGFAEMGIGALLIVTQTSRWAAWAAIALFVAVFPANVHMTLHPELYDFSPAALWLRLPAQALLIAWAWWYTRTE